jgi:hypothetical protein
MKDTHPPQSPCWKIGFASKGDAGAALRGMRNRAGRKSLTVYRCPHCSRWHHGSRTDRQTPDPSAVEISGGPHHGLNYRVDPALQVVSLRSGVGKATEWSEYRRHPKHHRVFVYERGQG